MNWKPYRPPTREPSTPLPIALERPVSEPYLTFPPEEDMTREQALETALTELVELMDLRKRASDLAMTGKATGKHLQRLHDAYQSRQPLALEAARNILRTPYLVVAGLTVRVFQPKRSIYDPGEFEPRGPVNDLPAV